MSTNKKPNFETVKQLIDYTNKNKLSVEFLEMNQFAYSDGKYISINKNLSNEAKIFMLAHEIGHIFNGKGNNSVNHFSLKFEKEDRFALDALFGIHENDEESFRFESLFKYSYFKKIEKPFCKMKKIG